VEQKHKNMIEKTKQVVKREIEKLPKENQEAIGAIDWIKTTEEIGKKYLFNESDLNNFQAQTLLVLIGLEDADFYSQNLEREVVTSKKMAEQISEEVLQKIFNPIGKAILEKTTKNIATENADHEQNINFILSGGNYAAFIKKEIPPPSSTPTNNQEANPSATVAPENNFPGNNSRVDPYREKPE
jgi:hypothetical protein